MVGNLSIEKNIYYTPYTYFWPTLYIYVESAPSENEYKENFLGVKAADAWG